MTVDRFFNVLKGSRYLNFIEECKHQTLKGPGELHHIYLKSFEEGRIDEDWNLVKLSIADHIRAHILLLMSFEDAGIGSESRSYIKAANTVDICCNIQWKTLSDKEKELLLESIPNLAQIRKKAIAVARDRVHKINAANWNGDSMGMCHTPERIQKSLETRTKKYGNPAGATHNEETYRKRLPNSIRTHIERYGGMTALMNTPEAREKAKKTMIDRYGSLTNQLHSPEARKKTRETRKQRGYLTMTDQMNTPEAREKARKSIASRFGKVGGQFQTPEAIKNRQEKQNLLRQQRMSLIRTQEFEEWWQENKTRFSKPNRLKCIRFYLLDNGISLK